MNWMPPPRWDTVAGLALDTFFKAVHKELPDYDHPLTIFGSAPIQLCLDEAFVSDDVDIMVLEGGERLREIAEAAGIGRSGVNVGLGVQICPPMLFKPTPHYLQRAWSETRHGVKVIIPHLRDVLIGKLHRTRTEGQTGLVAKDRRAFHRVRQLCGDHPTLAEVLGDLVACEACFRPLYDGSIHAFRFNAEDMLREIYHHTLDLQRDILSPASAMETDPLRAVTTSISNLIAGLHPDRD